MSIDKLLEAGPPQHKYKIPDRHEKFRVLLPKKGFRISSENLDLWHHVGAIRDRRAKRHLHYLVLLSFVLGGLLHLFLTHIHLFNLVHIAVARIPLY